MGARGGVNYSILFRTHPGKPGCVLHPLLRCSGGSQQLLDLLRLCILQGGPATVFSKLDIGAFGEQGFHDLLMPLVSRNKQRRYAIFLLGG